jgi:hypothetical protein
MTGLHARFSCLPTDNYSIPRGTKVGSETALPFFAISIRNLSLTCKVEPPWAEARGSSTCFAGRNPPKHTPLGSYELRRVKKEGRVFWYGYCVPGVKRDWVLRLPSMPAVGRHIDALILDNQKLPEFQSVIDMWSLSSDLKF